jgi:hypothetical protein
MGAACNQVADDRPVRARAWHRRKIRCTNATWSSMFQCFTSNQFVSDGGAETAEFEE